MGEQDDDLWVNGLRPVDPGEPVFRILDSKKWMVAEQRAAELIACIKPTRASERQRLAVADYVRRLVMQCFPCQVFTFGSVPLKTYLPDGDIDLTTFSLTPDLKDSWASDVRHMLECEEKNENAEFCVKEVQLIQAEVKVVKCLVENLFVDISFNQIGGVCTLCFLEEVDHMINQNHLFKRSIILIKAWCYYESRILGAHHGLISTYALETLVLYIFHIFNDTFQGPLEVLYRFLEFFSKFDWEKFCVSLQGPIPIDSLPEMSAETPRRDNRKLLLSRKFLDACRFVYGCLPSQELQNTDFPKRSFNVVDPLRMNNNIGRSVSKGNFFRIRSAFGFGAIKLTRLLDCPEEDLLAEINQFFVNTWQRHGSRVLPDTPCMIPRCLRSSSPDSSDKPNCRDVEKQEPGSVEEGDVATVAHSHAWKNHMYERHSILADKPSSSCSVSDDATDSEVFESRYRNSYLDAQTFRLASKENFYPSVGVDGTLEEEQDRANMIGASVFHGSNGHFQLPFTLPFMVPPSVLASLSSGQTNFGGFFPGNVPMVFSPANMQLPVVSSAMTHYLSGNGLASNNSGFCDALNDGIISAQMSSREVESGVWTNRDGSSNGRFDLDNGISSVTLDENQPSMGNYRSQQELLRNNHFDLHQPNAIKYEEHDYSRVLPSACNTTLKSRTSSVSSSYSTMGMVSNGNKETHEDECEKDLKTATNMFNNDNNVQHPVSGCEVQEMTESNHKIDHSYLLSDAVSVRWDILDSDFDAHWHNFLHAHACLSTQYYQGLVYSPQFVTPPVYRFPSGGAGRPFPGKKNGCTQLTSDGGHFIPVTGPLMSMPNRMANVYPPFVGEVPRCRGTGTFLPNHVYARDRQVSGYQKGAYGYDRNDHQNDREGNPYHNKPRSPGPKGHPNEQRFQGGSK